VLRERQLLDGALTVVGRCTAEERVAAFLLGLYERLKARLLARDHTFMLPLTQAQLLIFTEVVERKGLRAERS
jgi:CRP-like cAMP-binding protein